MLSQQAMVGDMIITRAAPDDVLRGPMEIVATGYVYVVVDRTHVRNIDSSGLGALAALSEQRGAKTSARYRPVARRLHRESPAGSLSLVVTWILTPML